MKPIPTGAHPAVVVCLCAAVVLGATNIGRTQQDDYATCVAEQYDRVKTDVEIARTIGACTRVMDRPSVTAEQRVRAYYFRGLNHFLDAVRLAIEGMKPLSSDLDAVKAALADLAACIAVAPEPSPFPFSLRATIHTALEQYDPALADLEQAIRADPKSSIHLVQRALIFERLDRFAEAKADLDAAVTLDPKNQTAWINRARLWTRYGDIGRAFSDYDRAESVGGTQTWDALSGRGKLAVRLGDPRRAFADWTRAAEVSALPLLAAQFHVRAGNLARDYLKEMDRAQQSYARALTLLPNHADAFIQRGIAYERANRFEDASGEYRKAIDIAGGNALDRAVHEYARYRLEVLRSRLSRKTGDAALPPNVNVLSRPAGSNVRDGGRRVALVLGNAAYTKVSPLLNADRDAESVGGALSDAGFARVTVATNLDRAQLALVLEQFSAEAADADWAVIFYAGHGIEAQGRNYIIPVDASLDTLRDAPSHAISLDDIMKAVGPAKKLRLIALDACRDNPFVQEAHRVAALGRSADQRAGDAGRPPGPAKDIGGGFAELKMSGSNTVVLYSTQPGQVALDGDELNSPFTLAFLKNIPVPDLDLRQFFERVRDDVANVTQRRQRPAINGNLRAGEQFFFFHAL